jgi:hypothetical protein
MTKKAAWKILNPILLVLAINQLVTAIICEVQGTSRPILSEEAFEFLHEGTGYVLVGLILLHLMLNFDWVKSAYFKNRSR